MKKLLTICLASTLLTASEEAPLSLDEINPFTQKGKKREELLINNRPLTRVLGKTISLYDVVKRMDLFLYEYYPSALDSKASLYQFYMTNWRDSLDDMIADQLMLADAKAKDMDASEGEVRQEMEERFGPNIMSSLSKMDLDYEEAKEMIHTELVVRKMSWFKIHSKAMQDVTPEMIKKEYQVFCQNHPPTEEWTYQMISIRGDDESRCEEASEKAYELCSKSEDGLAAALAVLKNDYEDLKISVSDDFCLKDKALSKPHKSILSSLKEGDVSLPTVQKSRNGDNVYRVFHLKEHIQKQTDAFVDTSEKLKQTLIRQKVDTHRKTYVKKLKERYSFSDDLLASSIPRDYQPFILQ